MLKYKMYFGFLFNLEYLFLGWPHSSAASVQHFDGERNRRDIRKGVQQFAQLYRSLAGRDGEVGRRPARTAQPSRKSFAFLLKTL